MPLPNSHAYYAYAPENGFRAAGPAESYTGQPYYGSMPAPTPPAQTTVEQRVQTELEKPETSELRQWLNYKLGSPGEQDPTGVGAPNPLKVPAPATAPGEDAPNYVETLEEDGLDRYKIVVPETFEPGYGDGKVFRVDPAPGSAVQAGQEVTISVTPTDRGSAPCERGLGVDPEPQADPYAERPESRFPAWDPTAGAQGTVPFRWGDASDVDRGWGWRHIEWKHGWDPAETALALNIATNRCRTPSLLGRPTTSTLSSSRTVRFAHAE